MENHLHSSKKSSRKSRSHFGLLFVTIFLTSIAVAQVSTVSTTNSFLNNNGSGTVTFNLQNTNNYDIIITDIEGVCGSSGSLTADLYYRLTPVSAAPSAIDTSDGWNLAATGAFIGAANTSTTITQPFLSGISFILPANTTYGMAVYASGQRYFTHPGGTTIDSAGGVHIITGTSIGFGGGTPPAAPGNTPRGWIGKITFYPAVACSGTTFAGNATSTSGLVCASTNFNLSLSNDSLRTGVNYQWQASSTGTPFTYTDMLNDTTRTISTTQTATTYYRCITKCGGTSPDTSTAVMVTTPTTALAGSYTVNPALPTSATNYQNLADFATTLSCVGVSAPVTLDVAANSGPYDAIAFGSISGASATNTITLNGHGSTIESNTNIAVSFWGTQYVHFNGFNIVNTGGGVGIHIGGQSQYLTIDNNIIDVGMISTATANSGLVVSNSLTSPTATGNNAQNLTITNNEIIGGYYGLTLTGSGSYLNCTGHLIQNNIVRDFYAYGIYMNSVDTVRVIGNDVHRMNRPIVTTFYGIYESTSRNLKIIGNKIHDAGNASYTAYPIYFSTSVNSPGYESEIVNNEIYNINTTTTIYGFYLAGTRDYLNVYHNTISLDIGLSGSGTIRAIYLNGAPNNHNVKNNIVLVTGNGSGTKHCIYVSTTSTSADLNHNNYVMDATSGTNYLGYWSGNRVDLGAWQTASTQDSNSVSIDPLFTNPTMGNFEPFSSLVDNLGTPVGVLTDITGNTRNASTPDIGAIEFTIPFCTSPPLAGNTLTDNASACKGQNFLLSFDTLTTTGIGQTYQWEVALDSVGPYVAMPNDTNIIATTNQLKSHWYRIALTCSGLTSHTAPVMVYTDSVGVPSALTIDTALSVSATNFHTFSDLVTLLNCKGVTAPTTITLAPYNQTFTENVDFRNIGGASDINTITIYGNGNTLESSGARVMTFSNTHYVTVDSLNILASGATGYGIHISNASSHITVRKSKIQVNMVSTSTLTQPIVVSGSLTSPTTAGNNAQYVTVENNELIGGYYSITLMGNTGPADNYGHKISHNIIRDFYAYGVYLSYADSSSIEDNDVNRANRTTVTTLYGIYASECKFIKIKRNSIHETGSGSYSAYPIYISHLASDTLYESEIINNRIFNIDNIGTFYGIYAPSTSLENVKIYHNTIQHEQPAGNTGTIRGFYVSVSNTNVDFRNNIVSLSGAGTGAETGIYISSTSTSFISNNNAVFVNSGNYGYWSGAQTTLANWQTATTQGTASNESDPVFTDIASGNLVPISGNIDNIGTPLGVLTDLAGAIRSTTTPDPGAYEFTGVAGDVALVSGELIRSGECYSFNDTLAVTIQNLVGSTIDFAITPVAIDWNVTGPQSSSGVMVRSFGTLAPGASVTFYDNTVNRSAAGSYTLHTNLQLSSFNMVATNDTLQPSSFLVKPILSVSPKNITVTGPADTVVLTANSPLFPGAGFFITEVSHYKYTVGQPTTGWPSYLLADDYIEITGSPNSDLGGITLEQYSTTALVGTFTFPSGTLLSPNGTAIIAIGQLSGSVDSPTDFYYNGNGTYTGTWGSGTAAGLVLRDASSAIIDAVGYGTYTFPAISGVTAADWSGNTPSGTTTSGNRLTGSDVNSATNWVNSSTSPQNPNSVNSGVVLPVPPTVTGFDWTYLGGSFSTSPKVTVGPYITPGVYAYVASFSNTCGIFYDTAYVTASSTVPVKLVSFTAKAVSNDVHLSWQTASEENNSHFDIERSTDGNHFTSIGTVKGNGTTSRVHEYQLLDKDASLLGKTIYYRLRQVDFDQKFTLSSIAIVRFEANQLQTLRVHPNPFSDALTLTVDGTKPSMLNVSISDLQGRQVSNRSFPTIAGLNTISLNNMTVLDKGFYFVHIVFEGETKIIKMLKN